MSIHDTIAATVGRVNASSGTRCQGADCGLTDYRSSLAENFECWLTGGGPAQPRRTFVEAWVTLFTSTPKSESATSACLYHVGYRATSKQCQLSRLLWRPTRMRFTCGLGGPACPKDIFYVSRDVQQKAPVGGGGRHRIACRIAGPIASPPEPPGQPNKHNRQQGKGAHTVALAHISSCSLPLI